MTLRIVFRRSARREFDDAADRYDEQRPGLGEEFIVEIDQRSPTLQPAQSAIQLYSAMFDERWHAASHTPCISGFAGMRWLSLPSFMVAEIQPSGSVGYNHPSQRTRQSGHHVFKGGYGRAFERSR